MTTADLARPAAQPKTTVPHVPEHDATLLESIADETARYRLALEPTTFDEAWRLSEICARGKLCGVKTPDDAYLRITIGRAIGLPAMASVQGIRMLYDAKTDSFTTVMYARMKAALLISRNDIIEYFRPKASNNESSTWVAKRRGQPEQEYTFTIEEARVAGLVGRGKREDGTTGNNYDKHPRPMLDARASGRLADIVGADILTGIASFEEVKDAVDLEQIEAQEQRAHVAAVVRGDVAPATPPQAAAPRDFDRELAQLKRDIADAVEKKDTVASRSARQRCKEFSDAAPVALVEQLQAFYGMATGRKPKPDGAPAQSATAAPAATPDAPPAATTAKAEYLPPHLRGDSYEGPEDPLS